MSPCLFSVNFSGWQGMDKSGGDEVFTGQDSGAQNSQGKTFQSIILSTCG